ncbi:MAG: RnfH family protein [Gammaproteobacteria bacterium]|nr:RnfH family protein [Gammaproteobacteria bacterium]MDH4312468.1 RnfH family protein [Gammaproteobacteria bacterium]MDH5274331.1 RnfH family protein [Gammaproteobacteria bacterium]
MGERAAQVEVVYALPDRQRVVTLPLPETGLTAQAAVESSGLLEEFPALRDRPLVLGIYGTVCAPDRPLRDRDRVEIYRPLRVDPRAQRRERAANAARKGRKR